MTVALSSDATIWSIPYDRNLHSHRYDLPPEVLHAKVLITLWLKQTFANKDRKQLREYRPWHLHFQPTPK